jgi:hypothetical protein
VTRIGAAVLVLALAAGCGGGTSSGERSAGEATESAGAQTSSQTVTKSHPPIVLPITAGGFLKGNAHPNFPAGRPGKVDVVSIGSIDRSSGSATLPVIFRNNTARGIAHVELSATARTSAGKVVASGSSQDIVPAQIQPGGLGLGYIYFEHANAMPAHGTRYTFAADTSPADTSSYNTAPVKITEANNVGGAIVGTGVNTTGEKLTGPYSVDAFCFNGNQITRVEKDFANEDGDLPPRGTISFSIDLNGDSCTKFLVGSSGFFA